MGADVKFDDLIDEIKSYNGGEGENEMRVAWEFAKDAHSGQKRKSGDPYAIHLLETAIILSSWKLDHTTVISGLLHDTVEDGAATYEDIAEQFGEEVAVLVDGVTKVSDLHLKGKKDEQTVENLRKLVLVMAKDLRVVFVKLADRLHNMRTLQYLSTDKQKRIARETLEIYAPLADRIGMGHVRGELEDLSFKYLYPMEYEKLLKESKPVFRKVNEHIKRMHHDLLTVMADHLENVSISARAKGLYSLWKKIDRKKGIENIHDIVAMRILVDSREDCYIALGILNKVYRPQNIRDYIAQPKPNGYSSIHVNVFGPNKRIVEVQIRTHKMHEHAEYGAAAHWAYAESKSKGASDERLESGEATKDTRKLSWVKQLVAWQDEINDSSEYIEAVKFDALRHRMFIFSPKGDLFDLPVGATPVDYACAVHTRMVQFIKAAKVNGKIVPLDYELESRDLVEILKNKNPVKPPRDWLRFVKTTSAKREIKKAHGITMGSGGI